MRLLHGAVEFYLSGKKTGNLQIEISVFSYLHYTLPLTRNYERPVVCYENNREESTTLSRISIKKTLFANQKSTLTAHTKVIS